MDTVLEPINFHWSWPWFFLVHKKWTIRIITFETVLFCYCIIINIELLSSRVSFSLHRKRFSFTQHHIQITDLSIHIHMDYLDCMMYAFKTTAQYDFSLCHKLIQFEIGVRELFISFFFLSIFFSFFPYHCSL